MRPHPHLAAPLLALALLTTGCGDSDTDPSADPTPSVVTASPTSSAESSPAASSAPTAPPLPSAAQAPTEDGARAFIRHFWTLVDYANATGDVAPIEAVSGPNCSGCEGGAAFIDTVYSQGGHIEADPYEVRRVQLRPLEATDGTRAFDATVTTFSARQLIVVPGKDDQVVTDVTETSSMTLFRNDDQWRVEVLGKTQ